MIRFFTPVMASYGEFEFRRKIGRYYGMRAILPKGIIKPEAAVDCTSDKAETVSEIKEEDEEKCEPFGMLGTVKYLKSLNS